jgi:DNA-binding transcriptional regulator YbjK
MPAPSRGRSTRGQHRRAALIKAAAELLLERGITAVSHRSVAKRAELTVAATTYYFASLEDLTYEALSSVFDRWTVETQGLVDRLPAQLNGPTQVATAVLEIATARPAEASARTAAGVMAMYERYLEAGRHPGLRPLVHAYNEGLLRQVGVVLSKGGLPADVDTARLTLAVVDGAALFDVAEGVAPASSATGVLARMLRLLYVEDGEKGPSSSPRPAPAAGRSSPP